MVDQTDFQILTRLQTEPFASWEAVGRGVGLSGTAVKGRLERLGQEAVLTGFRGLPAAETFGRHPRLFTFAAADDGERLVEEALAMDPVVCATLHQNGCVTVLAYARTPSSGPPEGLVDRAGCGPTDGIVLRHPTGRSAPLSPLDWRLLDVLLDAPRLPVHSLAETTGLSAKTVRKRRDALFQEGHLSVVPLLQSARASGWLLFQVDILLTGTDKSVALPRCTRVATYARPAGVSLFCHAASLAEVVETERRIRAIPGVKSTSLTLALRQGFATERLRGWIQEERTRWETTRRVA